MKPDDEVLLAQICDGDNAAVSAVSEFVWNIGFNVTNTYTCLSSSSIGRRNAGSINTNKFCLITVEDLSAAPQPICIMMGADVRNEGSGDSASKALVMKYYVLEDLFNAEFDTSKVKMMRTKKAFRLDMKPGAYFIFPPPFLGF